jgi:plasmid replication initiation protein
MNKSMTVNQKFNLVNAKYKLTPLEMKFILNAIAHLDSINDEVLKEYEIKISELESKMQIGEGQHTRLKQFAKRLMSKPLIIESDNGDFEVYNWFSRIKYVNKEAKFLIRFEEGLKPYLLQLKERFISYNLKYILPLTSTYSVRIYQLLKEREKLAKRYFTVEELQDILQVPPSYKKKYNDFKKKVLQVAEKEINEHTDIRITIDEEKEGRKVSRLIFRIAKAGGKNIEKQEKKDYSRFLKKTVYYNGEDRTIINVWESKEHKGYLLVQMIDSRQETLTDEIHITQLEKMVDYAENRPTLF